MSSWERFQMTGLEQGTGGFCRTSRGGEQGTPLAHLCAECKGQIRAPTLPSASHGKFPTPVGSLRGLTSRKKETIAQDSGQNLNWG